MKSLLKTAPALCLLLLCLSGCLKDKHYDKGSAQSLFDQEVPDVIEIGLTAASASNFLNAVYENSNRDTFFQVPVNLASTQPAAADIQVTLASDAAVVTAYNTANGTAYTTPSANMYTIENAGGVVTIPKGAYTGYLRVRLKPSAFLGGDYAFGFRIASVQGSGYTISGNLNKGVVHIAIKNEYEGNYRSVGYFQHPTSPRDINKTKFAATVNANTVALELGDLGQTALIYLTVNADRSVTITPGPGANAATANIGGDPVYNNKYDPATRTFRIKYGYPSPASRIITETLTRQ